MALPGSIHSSGLADRRAAPGRKLSVTLAAHALAAAILCSLPHWVALVANRGDYTPFSVSPAVSALTFDETHAYAPPVRHFLLTGHLAAEVDNYEHRKFSAGIPYLPIASLGVLGTIAGGAEQAFIAADFVFPALLFLLLYRIASESINFRSWRLLVVWSSLVIPFGLLNSIWLGDDALASPLEVTRTPQPEVSLLILLLAAALTGRALLPQARMKGLIVAGFTSGAIVYCYYFYAIAWGAALALILALSLIWKRPLLARRTAFILATTTLVALPYAALTWQGKSEGGQSYLLARMGAYTHRPNLLPLFGALLALTLIWRFGRILIDSRPVTFVLAALVTGALFGMNLQMLSGYETQPWHFWKRLALPLTFFLAVTAAARWIEGRPNPRQSAQRALAGLLMLLLILDTGARLTYAALRTASLQRASEPRIALLAWVRTHLPREQVIGTVDPQMILLIPAITADYTYVPSGLRSLTSNEEIVTRYFQLACLLGLPPAQVAAMAAIPNHLGHSTQVLQVLGLSYTGDPEVYRTLVHDYDRFHQHCEMPEWRLDLVIVSGESEMKALKTRYPAARTVYRNELYRLVEVREAGARP